MVLSSLATPMQNIKLERMNNKHNFIYYFFNLVVQTLNKLNFFLNSKILFNSDLIKISFFIGGNWINNHT